MFSYGSIQIMFLFFLSTLHGVWDLSSLARDGTCVPCIGEWSLDPWTIRDVPGYLFFSRNVIETMLCPSQGAKGQKQEMLICSWASVLGASPSANMIPFAFGAR